MKALDNATREQLQKMADLMIKKYGHASEQLKQIRIIAERTWQDDKYRWEQVLKILDDEVK